MYANRRNFRVLKKIGAKKHDDDVRFKTGSGNMAVLCMRNAFGHRSLWTWLWGRYHVPQNVFLI